MIKDIMRQITLVMILLFGVLSTAFAQEKDPWVGTWTSESYRDIDWENSPEDEIVYATFKRIIRITYGNGQYQVRSKIIKIGDPDYVHYARALIVKEVNGNIMLLESFLEKEPFYVNDTVKSYSEITYRMRLSLNNGILHYSFYEYYAEDYNSKMVYTGSRTVKVKGSLDGDNIDLYNDNW